MSLISRCCAALLAVLSVLSVLTPALAQAPATDTPATATATATQAPPEVSIADLRGRFAKLPTTAENNDQLRALLAQINLIAAQADAFITARSASLTDLNARLGELGPLPAAPATEDPNITRQRAALTKQRNAVDSDIRLAKLLAIDAQQRSGDMVAQRRKLFEAKLTERAPSPLGREFWVDLSEAWPGDRDRLQDLGAEFRRGMEVVREPQHLPAVLVSIGAALLLALLGNWLAEIGLARLATRFLPRGRLRRSLLVIAIVGTNVLLVAVAAQWLLSALDTEGAWGPQTRKVAQAVVAMCIFVAVVAGLGRALLSVRRPSWRLPPMPDAMAQRLAPFPWLVALVGALVWAPVQINAVIDASDAAVLATHVFTALALTAMIAAVVMRLGITSPVAPASADSASDAATEGTAATVTPPPGRPAWIGLLLSTVMVVLVAIWVLLAFGYVAMASFLAAQLNWGGIVLSAFYVLYRFADDLFAAVVSSKSRVGMRLQRSFGFAPRTLDQAAVVLSGLSRVALFFYMVVALAAPLGTTPGEVFQRSGKFGAGLKIGEFELVPGAIFTGIAVAVAGFIALRVLKRWLSQRYFPSTALEPGMQSSIITLLGYAGGIMVVAISLSALGIGVNRIAWVASALSVGIGFGLQAIVQNFISGLILLAERPVKVGDWVVLGTAEGDVRRINVRATEIQLGDRSTLIVPNSEFITKIVRNMTLTNAEGRVLIRLPMPLSTDAKKVRSLMLAACNTHPGVLPTPAPSVTLEGVEAGTLIFQAIAFVPSPRLAGGVRSDLLFEILDSLRSEDLPLSVPTMLVANQSGAPTVATPAESPPGPAQT